MVKGDPSTHGRGADRQECGVGRSAQSEMSRGYSTATKRQREHHQWRERPAANERLRAILAMWGSRGEGLVAVGQPRSIVGARLGGAHSGLRHLGGLEAATS